MPSNATGCRRISPRPKGRSPARGASSTGCGVSAPTATGPAPRWSRTSVVPRQISPGSVTRSPRTFAPPTSPARAEPLRVLLNQQDPGQLGRNLVYYGYFGRARAAQVAHIDAEIATIDESTARIEAEDAELERLEQARHERLAELEDARRQRSKVLAELQAETRDRQASLKRLQITARGPGKAAEGPRPGAEELSGCPDRPERCVREAARPARLARRGAPERAVRGGASRRGALERPPDRRGTGRAGAGGVPGARGVCRLAARARPAADRRSRQRLSQPLRPQRSALQGRRRDRCGRARPWPPRATAAGRAQTALYFEIRRAGKPVDPGPWFKGRAPPAP